MEIIKERQRIRHNNSQTCSAFEYPSREPKINGAVTRVKGRYPLRGWVMNKKCTELVYILRGSGTITVEGKRSAFAKGDMIVIPPGEKYFWRATSTMFVAATPAWYPEQHEAVD